MNVENIDKEIKERGDSSYFEYDFGNWVSKNYDVSPTDVSNMIRVEAQHIINIGSLAKRRNQWGLATQRACENVLRWLRESNEYIVDTKDLIDLARFVNSHRQACVWAVLIGKARAT